MAPGRPSGGAVEKEKRFKLFVPPRLSAGQWSVGRSQGFNKCLDDDFKLPFDVSNPGKITDSDIISQQVKLCSEVDEENTETRNDLFSKLYNEAEKIKQWKLTMESELNQKERKLQENRQIIEAQKKTIQELQLKNDKLHLKLEDEIWEKEDLQKEATASMHLCTLFKETCTLFTEKTTKYEQEREETRQLYEELHGNMEISALTIQRDEKDGVIKGIQAQLQISQNKIADLLEEKLHGEEMLKESQVSQEHLRAKLEEADISLQKAEKLDHVLKATQKNLEAEVQTTVKTLIEVTREKEAQEEECKKLKALLAAVTEELEISTANLKSLLQKEQNRSKKYEDESKLVTLELQKKSAELEEMTKVKCDKEVQLEELSETLKEMHGLKAQLTSTAEKEQDHLNQLLALKTDLQQETLKNEQLTVCLNKVSLEKEQIAQERNDVAAELKKLQEKQEDSEKKEENTKQLVVNLEEANGQLRNELESLKEKMAKTGEEIQSKLDEKEENVNKLQLEMENMNKQHKEAVDIYQKEIETRKVNEKKLNEQVEKLRLLYEEAAVIQRETDTHCQHKITEMVALMEKHKNEYDKMVEEKDAELRVYKIKQQKQLSSERALENELSCLKRELSSVKEKLKAEVEEKENLVKEHSRNMIPESERKHKTYIIKTPPTDKLQSGRSTNLPSEQSTRKKQKVLVQLDCQSDSSEHTDLLSIVSEEEMFKQLYKDYPQASQLHSTAAKKTPAPCHGKSPGSALKLQTMRRMRQAGWAALSKMDRKRKIQEAVKLFA
ncbi:synaptonemal complex protein 1-like isoform 4-T4 [Acridotheres tristis]